MSVYKDFRHPRLLFYVLTWSFIRKHDKNYIRVIFIITVCSSVAFANCDFRHPWLTTNVEFYKEKE